MVWRLEETWPLTNLTWSVTRESLPNDTRWRKSALATSVEDVIDDIMTEIKTI